MKNPSDYDKQIADRILWLRTHVCEMTQIEFADALGCCQQHSISCYETGKLKPGLNRCIEMVKLAKKHNTDISVEWLRPDLL